MTLPYLVGKDTEAPEEGVAAEVIDGGASQAELAEFGDALFDDRSLVVAAPGGVYDAPISPRLQDPELHLPCRVRGEPSVGLPAGG